MLGLTRSTSATTGESERDLPYRTQVCAAWNKCPDDEGKKAAFIAGYVVGWERNERPPLQSENIVLWTFDWKPYFFARLRSWLLELARVLVRLDHSIHSFRFPSSNGIRVEAPQSISVSG